MSALVARGQLMEIASASVDLLDLIQPLQADFPPEVHGAYARLEEALQERDEPEAPEGETMRHIQLTDEEHNSILTLLAAVKLDWEDNNRWTSRYQTALEAMRQAQQFTDLKPEVLAFADKLEAEAEGESVKQAITYEGIAARLRKEFG